MAMFSTWSVMAALAITLGSAQTPDLVENADAGVSLLQLKANFAYRSTVDHGDSKAKILSSRTQDDITIGVLTMSMARSVEHQNLSLSVALGIDKNSMYIPASYVSLYESVGARVVPIRFDLPEPALKSLFQQVNGLVIPGGTVSIFETGDHPKFRAAAKYLMELAMESNDAGVPFPVHGTCAGFELMSVLTAETDSVLCPDCFQSSGVTLPLIFTPAARSSLMFANASPEMMTALEKEPLAFNSHYAGISPANFANNAKLMAFWNVLATSKDTAGHEFISTMEAKQYPFTATQWHFEKPAFEYTGKEGRLIPHSQRAIDVGALLARNFAAEARKNSHRFASIMELDEAIIDKSTVKKDPRNFFDIVYVIGVEGESSYKEPVEQLQQYNEADVLGLPGHDWLPMSMELEMIECPGVLSAASPVSRMLGSTLIKNRDPALIAKWLKLTSDAVHQALQATPMSDSLQQKPKRAERLTSLYVKAGHDDEGSLDMWNWEKEKTGSGELELSSPSELTEDEMKFAVNVSKTFVGKFTGVQYSSFQSHVEARCLLEDDRVIGLMLLWEKYQEALKDLIDLRWRGPDFARSLTTGNPILLRKLQERWAQPVAGVTAEAVTALFVEQIQDIDNIKDERDGYRNFAINVCHLLDIDCCQNCTKNDTPKFGAVEFRMFNSEFGASMRLAIMLFQRIVQQSCTAPLEKLRSMTLNLHEEPAKDVAPLLDFLEMDVSLFHDTFDRSGPERWLWYCQ